MTTRLDPSQGSYVAPSFETATVADAMREGVVSCPPGAAGTEVARIMASRHIHSVVVLGARETAAGERLEWGVVSDTDILRAARRGLDGVTAAELAGTEAVTITPETSLEEAARVMVEHGITHLVVADGRHPVGVLSTLDIAGVLAWGRA